VDSVENAGLARVEPVDNTVLCVVDSRGPPYDFLRSQRHSRNAEPPWNVPFVGQYEPFIPIPACFDRRGQSRFRRDASCVWIVHANLSTNEPPGRIVSTATTFARGWIHLLRTGKWGWWPCV